MWIVARSSDLLRQCKAAKHTQWWYFWFWPFSLLSDSDRWWDERQPGSAPHRSGCERIYLHTKWTTQDRTQPMLHFYISHRYHNRWECSLRHQTASWWPCGRWSCLSDSSSLLWRWSAVDAIVGDPGRGRGYRLGGGGLWWWTRWRSSGLVQSRHNLQHLGSYGCGRSLDKEQTHWRRRTSLLTYLRREKDMTVKWRYLITSVAWMFIPVVQFQLFWLEFKTLIQTQIWWHTGTKHHLGLKNVAITELPPKTAALGMATRGSKNKSFPVRPHVKMSNFRHMALLLVLMSFGEFFMQILDLLCGSLD